MGAPSFGVDPLTVLLGAVARNIKGMPTNFSIFPGLTL